MTLRTFEEIQRFTQIWIWIVLIGVSIAIILQVPLSVIHKSGNEPMTVSNALIIIFSLVFVIGINALFYFARLTTRISDQEIQITFRPFINKPKTFRWDEIKEAYVRKYKPIWEYGGWGIRYRWNGKAFSTSGNQGLQLMFKSGKKILIGTHKPDELASYLKKYIFTDNQNF